MELSVEWGFPHSALWTSGAVILFWACPLHCRTFSGFSGFYPLDASSTLPSIMTTKNVFRHGSLSLGLELVLMEN